MQKAHPECGLAIGAKKLFELIFKSPKRSVEPHPCVCWVDYYAEFGIMREGKNFRLPPARTARAGALGKLVAALIAHKYEKKFGPAFWQLIATD